MGCRAFDKEERLTTKKIVVSHFESQSIYPFAITTRRSPVRPKSTGTSHKGGNKDRKTTELREIPDSLNEMSAEASEFLLVDEEVPSRSDVSFSVRLPLKPTVDDTTTEKTDMLQAPVHASSSSINTCSDYEGYKRLAATNNEKLMSGTNLQMLHIG